MYEISRRNGGLIPSRHVPPCILQLIISHNYGALHEGTQKIVINRLKTSLCFPLPFRSLSDECGKWELSDTSKSHCTGGRCHHQQRGRGGEDEESKVSPRGFVQTFSADLLNIRNDKTGLLSYHHGPKLPSNIFHAKK